ncbi:MAG TPA: site-specific integrase, partial [Burkholderiaceae bacterium]
MTGLEKALTDYLALRRSMGYKLEDGRLLGQFVVWLDERGATHVTVSDAVEWARMAPSGSPNRQAYRLSAVRVFARHLQSVDPRTQVPPTDMLPARKTRATPYLYSDAEILALLDAARSLASPLRTATYQTLIALLAVSGMRPGEARRLDLTDIDFANNAVVIRDTKFGKSREVPLHPTTIAALRSYLGRRDRHPLPSHEQAVFISSTGIRLPASTMIGVFRKLARRAGLP